VQAIPERYSKHNLPDYDEYFAMGRGLQKPKGEQGDSVEVDVPSLVRLQLLMAEDFG
jgi:hypothetical protein